MTLRLALLGFFLVLSIAATEGAEISLHWPLGRSAYQTNERIDLSVVRTNSGELGEGPLSLHLTSSEGSRLEFSFTAPKVAASGGKASRTEHLHLQGWLLRPGKYEVEVACDGTTAKGAFEVFSHLRRSSYKLVNWGRAKGQEQLIQGEDNLGFNLFYGHYGNDDEANFLRGGIDFMANCVMSGGHQMDLRMECDWSDPYVIRGGTRRVTRRALVDRTRPNVYGVHFYDEPGLTWHKHPETGEFTPHGVPAQVRTFEAAFGKLPPSYHKIDPKNPQDVAAWRHWARWKLGFMDAAWQDSQFGVSEVRPDYLSVTQSQYGFSAFTDGYYFNVVRSLPVTSGHGGYHDWGPGLFNPGLTLEFARARDFDKPCWYLPTWYGNTTTDEFRAEQYMAFQTNLQGMISPPDIDNFPAGTRPATQGVVESNQLMSRLGTIFTNMKPTRPPVALLFSLSESLHQQTNDRGYNYSHSGGHGGNIYFTFLAGKLLQHQFLTVVDEDIVDGTLAAEHKAVILTSIAHLDPPIVQALEDFAAGGGLVLTTSDCKVKVKGAIDIGVAPAFPDAAQIADLKKAGKDKEAAALQTMRHYLAGAKKLATAINPHLKQAGIDPVFTSSEPGIVATRQSGGDIDYLFAVNAAHDPEGNPSLGMRAVETTIQLPGENRPIYDAVRGGLYREFGSGPSPNTAKLSFGPGQMRVFARTVRPINTVTLGKPVVQRSYTVPESPITVQVSAAVIDKSGLPFVAPIPIEVTVRDALGAIRHHLYRATQGGSLQLQLPIAANDPAGTWVVQVRELLANTTAGASFAWQPAKQVGAMAGATERAVIFGGDRKNVFRFARRHDSVTLVVGSSDFDSAAAQRLSKVLAPWNIACKTVAAAEAGKARALTAEEAKTWIGLNYVGSGHIKPGEMNTPDLAGFAVRGPVILIGNPDDNPLIAFLVKEKFLPYTPDKTKFPGGGRGYVSWQRDAIGPTQESLALIAYDAAGMEEAVGTCYEAVAGMDPLTPQELPNRSAVEPAKTAILPPSLEVVATHLHPDRVPGLRANSQGLTILCHDGTLAEQPLAAGAEAKSMRLSAADYAKAVQDFAAKMEPAARESAQKRLGPTRAVKLLASGKSTAVGCWGGFVEVSDADGKTRGQLQLPQDVTALVWAGDQLVAGLADGRVVVLKVP